jgi:hypothetical protein
MKSAPAPHAIPASHPLGKRRRFAYSAATSTFGAAPPTKWWPAPAQNLETPACT